MDLKNLLTNIIAYVIVVATAIKAYLESVGTGSIDWFQLVLAVVIALIAYFTGKNADLSKKSVIQLTKQKEMSE